ncbi:hypothetical protein AAVH_31203, partial [Aphelenchoides avenae]
TDLPSATLLATSSQDLQAVGMTVRSTTWKPQRKRFCKAPPHCSRNAIEVVEALNGQ